MAGLPFAVEASNDPEYGWSAAATVSTRGFKTANAAARALEHSLARLLEAIRELKEP